MKLAILGTRGVPPNYGGFETFAAELGTRLIQRGHEVSVYCRSEGRAQSAEGRSTGNPLPSALCPLPSDWNGIRRIVLPTLGHKYFETVSHAFLSALDSSAVIGSICSPRSEKMGKRTSGFLAAAR